MDPLGKKGDDFADSSFNCTEVSQLQQASVGSSLEQHGHT